MTRYLSEGYWELGPTESICDPATGDKIPEYLGRTIVQVTQRLLAPRDSDEVYRFDIQAWNQFSQAPYGPLIQATASNFLEFVETDRPTVEPGLFVRARNFVNQQYSRVKRLISFGNL